ncbi:PREDICTED: kelch-like protein 20 [Gavialis gangeticus]|uniref:kelch-like protein 20 n=1 Tax=Gavialis gangeticus TaxID=94835 RepID=UPI00092E2621|nr:PREDICTED: kelch-like protein 20 [Gavialis gangeticus]
MFPWERVSACLASRALLRYWCNWGICFALGNSLTCRRKRVIPEAKSRASETSKQLELVFAMGGWHHRDAISGVEHYNPLQHEWELLGSVSRPHRGAGVASLKNCIYAIGGYDGTTCLSSVERYDPEANEWSCAVAPLQESKRDVGLAELGSYLYCVGSPDGLLCLSTVERYDPSEDKWCKVAPVARCRVGLGVAVLDGYLYAVGGSDGQSLLHSVERYDPVEDTWSPCPPLGMCREDLSCATFRGKIWGARTTSQSSAALSSLIQSPTNGPLQCPCSRRGIR